MAKILLVEDNEMNRDMLSRRLIKRGHDVVIAVDGQQGVDMARSEAPELILLDMSLPVMDGWEAARTLKTHDATQSIPIIALTAHAMADCSANGLPPSTYDRSQVSRLSIFPSSRLNSTGLVS